MLLLVKPRQRIYIFSKLKIKSTKIGGRYFFVFLLINSLVDECLTIGWRRSLPSCRILHTHKHRQTHTHKERKTTTSIKTSQRYFWLSFLQVNENAKEKEEKKIAESAMNESKKRKKERKEKKVVSCKENKNELK